MVLVHHPPHGRPIVLALPVFLHRAQPQPDRHPSRADPALSHLQPADRGLDLLRPVPLASHASWTRRRGSTGSAGSRSSGASPCRWRRRASSVSAIFSFIFSWNELLYRPGPDPLRHPHRAGRRHHLHERLRAALGRDHGDRHADRAAGDPVLDGRVAPSCARPDHGGREVGSATRAATGSWATRQRMSAAEEATEPCRVFPAQLPRPGRSTCRCSRSSARSC